VTVTVSVAETETFRHEARLHALKRLLIALSRKIIFIKLVRVTVSTEVYCSFYRFSASHDCLK